MFAGKNDEQHDGKISTHTRRRSPTVDALTLALRVVQQSQKPHPGSLAAKTHLPDYRRLQVFYANPRFAAAIVMFRYSRIGKLVASGREVLVYRHPDQAGIEAFVGRLDASAELAVMHATGGIQRSHFSFAQRYTDGPLKQRSGQNARRPEGAGQQRNQVRKESV